MRSEGYGAEWRSALPSQKVTPREGESLESGSLRNKCKFATLAKERHVILSQLRPDSASSQERSSPNVTKAGGPGTWCDPTLQVWEWVAGAGFPLARCPKILQNTLTYDAIYAVCKKRKRMWKTCLWNTAPGIFWLAGWRGKKKTRQNCFFCLMGLGLGISSPSRWWPEERVLDYSPSTTFWLFK